MNAQDIEVKNNLLRCVVRPSLGGALLALNYLGKPVLRDVDTASISSARQAGSFALLPFSNRVGYSTLHWMGTTYKLIQAGADLHAIHGVGWQRPWRVLEQAQDFLLINYVHHADLAWPFDFDASQSFKIVDNQLHQTLSLTNLSERVAPVGLGWHPYFVKRPDTQIAFKATSRWEMGEDQLPLDPSPSNGLNQRCEGLLVDHCFEGWGGDLELRDQAFELRITSGLNYLVVYTKPEMDSIAVEPVSHVNNAVNMAHTRGLSLSELGISVLQPGQTAQAQMMIEVNSSASTLQI
jgi:aldose 1-epimerase